MKAILPPAIELYYNKRRLEFHLEDINDVIINDPEMIQPTLEAIKHHEAEIKRLQGGF